MQKSKLKRPTARVEGATPANPVATPIERLNALVYGAGKADWSGERWRRYFAPVPELSEGLPVPIIGIMLLIWQLRDKDLQIKYPLDTNASRLGFIAWCVVHGRREYRSLRQATAFRDALNQPAQLAAEPLPEDDPAHAISWLMVLAVCERRDLNIDLSTRTGRETCLAWYVIHGCRELGFDDEPFENWQTRYLLSPSEIAGLNRLQALIYRSRPGLQQTFPLPHAKNRYIDWFRNFITTETCLIDALRTKSAASELEAAPADAGRLPFGANVIGYAFGQIGIGEDARMAVKSLVTTDVPVTLLNFSPGSSVPQNDRSMADFLGNGPEYSSNIFCLTALEHGRHFAETGLEVMAGRYNIGYWPWELPQWPDDWKHLLSLVDEVWVSTKYIHDALAPVSPVPVRVMPMAVEVSDAAAANRKRFNLPDAARLFLFAFDLNSSAKRKNPAACLAAFLEAFPLTGKDTPGREQVGLVIKVHPPKEPNKEWDQLKQLQSKDPRVHLIEETLSKADLLALYKTCDCFVSLHRAEGFGRCIAEAMLLELPTITTSFSGNLDFTTDENSLLVECDLIALDNGDYPYGEGQVWADPSVENAARQMKAVVERPEHVRKMAWRGRKTLETFNNVHAVGARYAQRLYELAPRGRAFERIPASYTPCTEPSVDGTTKTSFAKI